MGGCPPVGPGTGNTNDNTGNTNDNTGNTNDNTGNTNDNTGNTNDNTAPRPLNVCGDGVVDRSEQCDDGNTVDGDGCSSTCQIETPSPARCGDGVVNGTEQCDAGGETSTCNADCTNSRCGDGTVNAHAGEQCDDGNTVNGDGCSSSCHTETPPPSGCGDGVVNGTEECDGGGSETATCNTNCTTSRCGDSIVNTLAGEQCDDGNQVNGDGCSSTCQIESTTPPPPVTCGNGTVDTGEECDDGNTTGCDGCSATCQNELPNDCCSDAISVTDGPRSYSNLGATTDGPDEPTMCVFEFGNTNVDADIWYCYTATCTGTAIVSLCGSDYDTKLAVYAGCDCPTAAPLDCSDDDCGTGVENVQSRVTFTATAGQKFLLRVGGYLGEQGDGRLTIGCNLDACANGTGDCLVPSPNDAPGCGDATCCGKTCDLDRFCCDVTWDATCAGEAEGVCDGSFRACGPGSGVCGTPDNTPGCDSASCCNKVCLVDPFCCLDSWDATCVDEAESMCFLTCGIGAGDCHAAHTTPGCNADACCQAVCTDDPFCCDTNWDQMCVDKAAASTSCP
jgi:cysteine-rich repeat protein